MNKIRTAEITDAGNIINLLNKATLHLHEKGINQWDYPWNPNEIKQEINSGHVYVISENDLITGTFSIMSIDELSTADIEKKSGYLYRIALFPEYQGKSLGLKIINYASDYLKKLNKPLYLDCWAGNERLKSFYKNAGFEYLGDYPEKDYFISVFMLK